MDPATELWSVPVALHNESEPLHVVGAPPDMLQRTSPVNRHVLSPLAENSIEDIARRIGGEPRLAMTDKLVPFAPTRLFAAEVVAAHWQLQSQLRICPADLSPVYTSQHSLRRIEQSTGKSIRISRLPFETPSSLACCADLVAIGSTRGRLAVVKSSLGQSSSPTPDAGTGTVVSDFQPTERPVTINTCAFLPNGNTVRGPLAVQSSTGAREPQGGSLGGCNGLLIAANDLWTRVFDFSPDGRLQQVQKIRVFPDSAVNCLSVNPLSPYYAAVGDAPLAALLDKDLNVVSTLKLPSSVSVTCDFDSSATTLAVGGQDGMVCLFDVRQTGRPLASFRVGQGTATMDGGPGSVRQVLFHPYKQLLTVQLQSDRVFLMDLNSAIGNIIPTQIITPPVRKIRGTQQEEGEREMPMLPYTWVDDTRLVVQPVKLCGAAWDGDTLWLATEKSISAYRGGQISSQTAASFDINQEFTSRFEMVPGGHSTLIPVRGQFINRGQ